VLSAAAVTLVETSVARAVARRYGRDERSLPCGRGVGTDEPIQCLFIAPQRILQGCDDCLTIVAVLLGLRFVAGLQVALLSMGINQPYLALRPR